MVPRENLPQRNMNAEVNERTLQTAILRALHAWRIPAQAGVTGVRSRAGARQISAARGMPDIVGVLPWGQFLGIEVKRKGEHLRPAQAEWISDTCQRAPYAVVIVAREIGDVTGPLGTMVAAWRECGHDVLHFWSRMDELRSWQDARLAALDEARERMEP